MLRRIVVASSSPRPVPIVVASSSPRRRYVAIVASSPRRRRIVVATSSSRRRHVIVAASPLTPSRGALTRCPTRCPHSPPQGLGALTRCPHFPKAPPCRRRVVVVSSHRAVVSSVCASILTASILTASILTAILTRVLIPGPQCWSSRRRVAVPAPILTAILTARSSPLVAASSSRIPLSSPILGGEHEALQRL